jgi:hypothetical protein
LARPLGRSIAQTRDADPARQSPLDGSLHEFGREEGERDCHIDLSNAAFLARSNLLDTGYGAGNDLSKPTPATRDRCDERRAGLGAYRSTVVWRRGAAYRRPPLPGREFPLPCCGRRAETPRRMKPNRRRSEARLPEPHPDCLHRQLAWLGSGPTRSVSQQSKPFGFFDLHGKLAFYIVTPLRYVGKLVPVKVEHEEANSR